MESLLFSPKDELLINRERLAMEERLRRLWSRSPEAEHNDAERSLGLRGPPIANALCIALVIVDLEEVKDGTSSTDTRTSGPGSPKCGDDIAR
jgi:hypothetical protein